MTKLISSLLTGMIQNFKEKYETTSPSIFPNSEKLAISPMDRWRYILLCMIGQSIIHDEHLQNDLRKLKRYLRSRKKWKTMQVEFSSIRNEQPHFLVVAETQH